MQCSSILNRHSSNPDTSLWFSFLLACYPGQVHGEHAGAVAAVWWSFFEARFVGHCVLCMQQRNGVRGMLFLQCSGSNVTEVTMGERPIEEWERALVDWWLDQKVTKIMLVSRFVGISFDRILLCKYMHNSWEKKQKTWEKLMFFVF